MRLNEMEAIYNYICNDLEPKNINEWQEYKKNMDNFFKALKPYYEADDKKQYKGITEDEYNKISKLFDDVAKASDDLMKAYENVEEKTVGKDGKPIPKVKDIVKNLNDQFFSKGYVEYKNIKPDPSIPLKDQLDNFRDLYVKMSNQDIKRLGGNQSSRLQMNVSIDGKEVKGVFTEKTFYNAKDNFGNIFSAFAEKYPKYKDFYEGIDPKKFFDRGVFWNIDMKNLLQDNGAIEDEEIRELSVKNYLSAAGFDEDVRAKGANYANDEGFYNSLLDLTTQLSNVSTNIMYNQQELELKQGERLDVRNSAMSAVATLIKVPDLIVKSRNLAVYDEAGKKITEGTFMEFAKGKDLNNLASIDEMRIMTSNNFENYQVKKQIANLQILDYICGNVDRHGGNMLYDIDPSTRNLKGIVGIDNDSSFGVKVNVANKNQVRLPSVNEMRVITEDMAKTITDLTEGQLKSTLHGYGLSQESIDAAWERTKQLKTAIKNGVTYKEHKGILNVESDERRPFITIMSDEDFRSVELQECAGRTKNYFTTMLAVKNIPTNRERVDERLTQKAYTLTLGLKSAIGKDQTEIFVNKAKAAAPKWFASSRYKNFMAKLNDYHKTDLKGDDPLNLLNKRKFDKLTELKNAIDVYKREKIRDGVIDDKWNLKKKVNGKDLDRILLVKDTEKYVNRIEQDKELALDMKLKHEANVQKVNEVNDFIGKNRNDQVKLVEDKLKAQGIEIKKDENVVEAKAFNNHVDNLIVRKVGKVIVIEDPDEDEFFSDTEELKEEFANNNNNIEKEM